MTVWWRTRWKKKEFKKKVCDKVVRSSSANGYCQGLAKEFLLIRICNRAILIIPNIVTQCTSLINTFVQAVSFGITLPTTAITALFYIRLILCIICIPISCARCHELERKERSCVNSGQIFRVPASNSNTGNSYPLQQ